MRVIVEDEYEREVAPFAFFNVDDSTKVYWSFGSNSSISAILLTIKNSKNS
jgi:hypothetical protein